MTPKGSYLGTYASSSEAGVVLTIQHENSMYFSSSHFTVIDRSDRQTCSNIRKELRLGDPFLLVDNHNRVVTWSDEGTLICGHVNTSSNAHLSSKEVIFTFQNTHQDATHSFICTNTPTLTIHAISTTQKRPCTLFVYTTEDDMKRLGNCKCTTTGNSSSKSQKMIACEFSVCLQSISSEVGIVK